MSDKQESTSLEEGVNSDPVEKETVEESTTVEPAGNEGEPETVRTFTQDEVNRMLGDVRKEGRRVGEQQAIDSFLEQAGVSDPEELEGIVSEHKELKLSAMTEKERSDAELAEAREARERAEVLASEATSKANEALLKSAVVNAAAGRFENAEAAYMLLDKSGLKISEDGGVEGLDDALESLLATYPFLKKGGQSSVVSATNPEQPEARKGRTDEQRRKEYFGSAKTDSFWKRGGVRKIEDNPGNLD